MINQSPIITGEVETAEFRENNNDRSNLRNADIPAGLCRFDSCDTCNELHFGSSISSISLVSGLSSKMDPPSNSNAMNLARQRLRNMCQKIEQDGDNVDKHQILTELQFSLTILDAVHTIKPQTDEEEALTQPEGDSTIPTEVREWLSQTFTNTQQKSQTGRLERPKLKSVAQAIRAGLLVNRIYRKITNSAVSKYLQQTPDITTELSKAPNWTFNVWHLNDVTAGHPLMHIGYHLFNQHALISKFKVPPVKMVTFLGALESGYSKHRNAYHNVAHGADVTQTVYSIIHSNGLLEWLSDLELFAVILAALIHDLEHTGTTNNYHIMTSSNLAFMYNDRSVLENHHIHTAFTLMTQPDKNILSGLKDDEYRELRALVIEMVLATDMTNHFTHLKQMKSSISNPSLIDRGEALALILHAADISHPAKPWEIHQRWVERLLSEFFKQGDSEKALGLPCSPLCDRTTTNIEKSQVGFIDYIVNPTMNVLHEVLHTMVASLETGNGPVSSTLRTASDETRSHSDLLTRRASQSSMLRAQKFPNPSRNGEQSHAWKDFMSQNRRKWAELHGQTDLSPVTSKSDDDFATKAKTDRSTSTTDIERHITHSQVKSHQDSLPEEI